MRGQFSSAVVCRKLMMTPLYETFDNATSRCNPCDLIEAVLDGCKRPSFVGLNLMQRCDFQPSACYLLSRQKPVLAVGYRLFAHIARNDRGE